MDMTFKDYMVAFESYEYSRENYELMKECSELSILDKFIENQLFAQENASLYENTSLANYMVESVDESNLDQFMEKAKGSSEGILKKIYNGMAKIIRVFATLLRKIGNKFDEVTSNGQAHVKNISSKTFTPDELTNLEKFLDEMISKSNGFIPYTAQPYAKKINIKTTESVDLETIARIKSKLAAALSNTVVKADVRADENRIGALSVEDINDIKIGLVLNPKRAKVDAAIKALTGAWTEAKLKGITINVNTKSIDKAADQLNSLQEQIIVLLKANGFDGETIKRSAEEYEKNSSAIKDKINTDNSKASDVLNAVDSTIRTGFAVVAESINKLYQMVNATVGASMRVYSGLNYYRQNVIAGLNNYIPADTVETPDNENK